MLIRGVDRNEFQEKEFQIPREGISDHISGEGIHIFRPKKFS